MAQDAAPRGDEGEHTGDVGIASAAPSCMKHPELRLQVEAVASQPWSSHSQVQALCHVEADVVSAIKKAKVGVIRTEIVSSRSLCPQLMIWRAPSLPSTPGSVGLGLRSRPFLRLRKANIPLLGGLAPFLIKFSYPSAGKVELLSASSLQLPVSSRTICTPPPLLILREEAFF